jgi:hypothetical protein
MFRQLDFGGGLADAEARDEDTATEEERAAKVGALDASGEASSRKQYGIARDEPVSDAGLAGVAGEELAQGPNP